MVGTSQTRLRAPLEEFRDHHRIPAIGAGVITHSGQQDFAVIGQRVRGAADPATTRDRWHVGSCGKSMTAALYARLVEKGDAEWGAPIGSLLPDLRGSLHPDWNGIAVDDLFVSRAGLPANLSQAELRAAWTDGRPLPEQRTQVAARALARAPHQPGRFLYSNLGYIVVGAAIERITQVPYESALRTHVFDPLGIVGAGFGPPPEMWGHRGRMLALPGVGAIDLGRGGPADPTDVRSDNPAVMTPAGRMHLGLEDWASFHRVFLTEGGGFLLPTTVERLLTGGVGGRGGQSFGWAPVPGTGDASFGQQGSNLCWVASAVIDRRRERTAMVVCNDGRPRLLRHTADLAVRLLA